MFCAGVVRVVVAGAVLVAAVVGVVPSVGGAVVGGEVGVPGRRVAVVALPEGDARFVDALYKDLLGRRSDAGGREFWLAQMAGGDSRSRITVRMAGSPEWRGRVVDQLFVSILGRLPTAAERSARIDQLRQRARVADIAAGLYGSSEFHASAGSTPIGFARALYLSALGRAPSPTETTTLTTELARGTTRTAAARTRFLSVEANATRVDDLYALLLFRASEPAGRTYWAGQLVTRDDIWMAAAVVATPEYYARAQRRVVTGTYTQPATTKTLPATAVAATGPSTVTLAPGTSVAVGDTIVVQPAPSVPDGLMRTITSRSTDPAGQTIATTTQATWDQAYPDLALTGILDAPSRPIVVPRRSVRTALETDCDAGIDGISIVPEASLALDVAFSWGPFRDDRFRFAVRTSLGYTATTTGALACELSLALPPVWLTIGPLAIQIDPSIDADLSLTAPTQLWARRNLTCTLGADHLNGTTTNLTGCTTTDTAGITTTQPTELTGTGHLALTIAAKAYGRVGIQGSIGPDITLTANPCTTPWWTIDGAITAGIDLIVDVFITDMAWTITQARILQRTIAQAPTGATQPPGCDKGYWTGATKATYDFTQVNSAPCGTSPPSCTYTTSFAGVQELRLLPRAAGQQQQIRRVASGSATGQTACGPERVPGPYAHSITADLTSPPNGSDSTGPKLDPSMRIAWEFLIPGALTTTACGNAPVTGDQLSSYLLCGTVVQQRLSSVPGDATSTDLAATIDMPVVASGGSPRCSYPTSEVQTHSTTGDLRVQYRYTRQADADGDGIPDRTDSTPTVFTPLG